MSNLGALDMALDDVISQNRSNNKRNTGARRNNSNNNNNRGGISKNRSSGGRSSPYGGRPSRNNSNNNTSRNSRPLDNRNNNSRNNNSLVVANLHFNVTEKDLYDLFGQIGQLKRAFLHIGPNGKSAGIADVVFVHGNDAERARNTYNNVELDGRPMRITTASIATAVSSISNNNNNGGRRNNNIRGGNNGRSNNNSNNSRGGRGRRETRPKPNQEDLDAEMDSYMGANNEDTQMN